MAQMKEQIKTPEQIQLSDEEIANTVQNTGNQDAHRNGWVWSQNRGEVKAMQSEIKKNIEGTNSEGKETGTQINCLDQKEEINIQLEQNQKPRIQKKWGEA